jgi:hypothetical protein
MSGSGARVGFVREEGLNLRGGPQQSAASLAQLSFGSRVRVLEDESEHPGWHKVAVPTGAVGFLFSPRVHLPPPELIARDPGMTMVRVRSGQTFWGLVREQYGIRGDEGSADQNMNHFINAIRAVNKDVAFTVETDIIDDIGNWLIGGRDASDTRLKAGYDLWIPSFGAAAAMDVGSGTVTGEVTRLVKKIEQKIDDFRTACSLAGAYIPDAVAKHAGDTALGLLSGLVEFALDAAKILAISTAVGALIGALFGGVGALPGAQIGFEIGLLLLEYYGLAMLIEAVLSLAGGLLSQLGSFVSQVWDANGDRKKLDAAGRTLADALGILVSAALIAVAAYLTKKGGEALAKTKFAGKVGQTKLAQWLADRQKMKSTKEALDKGRGTPEPTPSTPAPGTPAMRVQITERAEAGVARANAAVDQAVRTGDAAYFQGLGMSPSQVAKVLNPRHRLFKAEYGNAMERQLIREFAADPLLSTNVRHIGSQSGHVAGRGKPDFVIDSNAWGMQQFMDVTTTGARAAHVLRDYGKRVLQLTYVIGTFP